MTVRQRFIGWLSSEAVAATLIAMAISIVIAWFALDLWSMRWDVPLVYNGDGLAVASHFKTVIDTGWYESQAALGAPFGQTYHDYPTADNLHFVVAWLLGLAFPWGTAMNLHFLLGFPLAAATAVWFLRRVGVSAPLAVALSVLYSIAPYHFLRSEGHLFLSWYWVVPLALVLVWAMLKGQPVWGARPGARRGLGHLTGRTGGTAAILIVVGSASAYYAVFTLILGSITAIAAFWVARNGRRLLGAVAAGVTLIAVVVANMAPDLIYASANGSNPGALSRTPPETEVYALKLAQLLLPPSYHRFGPFRFLREQYDLHYPLPSEGPALGLIAAAGFVALVVVIFLVLARVMLASTTPRTPLMERLSGLSFLALLAFMFSMVGGLSTFISFVSTSLRAWNRMSIVIAAIALAAVGLLVDALVTRVTRRALSPRLAGSVALAAALALLAVGTWDQTPPISPAARAATVTSFDSDAAFAADLEAKLPGKAMLFELPYIDFPESPPVNRALDSDQFRIFLHSTDLRFSGGGIRGRADIDSLGDIAKFPTAQFVKQATELGFVGALIDTYAYTDDAELQALLTATGSAPLVSPDGRFVYVSLSKQISTS